MRRWLGQVCAWAVIMAAGSALLAAVVVPRLTGATPYTILTGSMSPTYPPGTLVVVEPVDVSDISVGDVITYQLRSGEPEVATHRVVSTGFNMTGERVFVTQGDANDDSDDAPVIPAQIRGRVWYSAPYLGYVNNAVNGDQRQQAVTVVAAGLIAYAAFMFVSSLRERRSVHA